MLILRTKLYEMMIPQSKIHQVLRPHGNCNSVIKKTVGSLELDHTCGGHLIILHALSSAKTYLPTLMILHAVILANKKGKATQLNRCTRLIRLLPRSFDSSTNVSKINYKCILHMIDEEITLSLLKKHRTFTWRIKKFSPTNLGPSSRSMNVRTPPGSHLRWCGPDYQKLWLGWGYCICLWLGA